MNDADYLPDRTVARKPTRPESLPNLRHSAAFWTGTAAGSTRLSMSA